MKIILQYFQGRGCAGPDETYLRYGRPRGFSKHTSAKMNPCAFVKSTQARVPCVEGLVISLLPRSRILPRLQGSLEVPLV